MKVAYFDAFSGLSGDMTVGALVDCGLALADLETELEKLGLDGYCVRLETRKRNGIRAAKFVVELERATMAQAPHPHRTFRDIRDRIRRSRLTPRVCEISLQVFAKLAEAEGKIHGLDPEEVTFHEVGALDSIIDIVGASWAIATLGIEEILVSPLPVGRGTVLAEHGGLPIPGPATAELLRGFPVRLGDGESEMVTPTGAAIVAALGRPAELPQTMIVERIGYGAGDKEFRDRPNLLRVLLGTVPGQVGADSLLLLETNLDDMNPELYQYVMERLFAEGARDVFWTPLQMKKDRPGVLLSVLCDVGKRDVLAGILFAETSTLGVRVLPCTRLHLEREIREIDTRFGKARVKIAHAPDGTANVAPEYEDCKRFAAASKTPLKVVYQEVLRAALDSLGD